MTTYRYFRGFAVLAQAQGRARQENDDYRDWTWVKCLRWLWQLNFLHHQICVRPSRTCLPLERRKYDMEARYACRFPVGRENIRALHQIQTPVGRLTDSHDVP